MTVNPLVVVIGSIGLLVICLYIGSQVGAAVAWAFAPKTPEILQPGWVQVVGAITAAVVGFGLAYLVIY